LSERQKASIIEFEKATSICARTRGGGLWHLLTGELFGRQVSGTFNRAPARADRSLAPSAHRRGIPPSTSDANLAKLLKDFYYIDAGVQF
jgi:hypothetical protein